jgi:hypothetical protein
MLQDVGDAGGIPGRGAETDGEKIIGIRGGNMNRPGAGFFMHQLKESCVQFGEGGDTCYDEAVQTTAFFQICGHGVFSEFR